MPRQQLLNPKGRDPLLNFRLAETDRARLERLARERGLSRSEVMRMALEQYLAQELEEAPKAS